MPSESLRPFEHLSFKSEDHETMKLNLISTKDSESTTIPTFILQCKSDPESLYETSSPQPGSGQQNGLLVSSTQGGNLMLYMPEECNSTNQNDVVTMEDHSTFNPNSPDAPSPMSTTCSQSSSSYNPSSPSVSSMGVPSPTSGPSRDSDLMLFDEDTISSLASILEETNEENISSSKRTLKCRRTSIAQNCGSPEALVPQSPRTTNQTSVFNFGLATSNTQFIETNFNAVTEVANQNTIPPRTSTRNRTKKSSSSSHSDRDVIVPQRKATRTRGKKNQSLTASLPSKQDGVSLQIAVQPEKQHRARYLTEGSRGSVKDESQQGFPTLKLRGVRAPVTLQVFVAADLPNRVKPHGYYQACKVTGRNTTPCTESDIEGTTIIEIQWKPDEENMSDDMEIKLDCVGILKLRNADVEQRIGLTRSKRKNTAVRLVFRVNMERADGTQLTLQQVSSGICCTQPLGHPEIIKKSLTRCSIEGNEELFIIGKNFVNKNTTVKLQEVDASGAISWEGTCEIDKTLFHNTHIVCTTPPFRSTKLEEDAEVYLVVSSGPGKTSEQYGHPMYYYMPGAGKRATKCNISSPEVHTTNSEGTLSFDLASLHMPSSHENSMDAPMTAMDVLNSLSQSAQQKEITQHFAPVTSTPAVAQLNTQQMHLTMSQIQPVMTSVERVPDQPVVVSSQIQTPVQPVATLVQQMTPHAATPEKVAPASLQFDALTGRLQQVTPQARPNHQQQLQSQPQQQLQQNQPQQQLQQNQPQQQLQQNQPQQQLQQNQPQQLQQNQARLQPSPAQSLSSILTPVASPKTAVSVNSLLNQIASNQTIVTSTPQLQISPVLQQQLQQQQQQQEQVKQEEQQRQLLPAETLLQAAQSLQALQAQAVQIQAMQPQVQAAALQVSAQLQLHAQKLQEQMKQKEQHNLTTTIHSTQQLQQQLQQQPLQQQIHQANEVSFADKLKAAAQMEVSQPGLLTKLAQQQNLNLALPQQQQQQTSVAISMPTLPSSVCSILNIQ